MNYKIVIIVLVFVETMTHRLLAQKHTTLNKYNNKVVVAPPSERILDVAIISPLYLDSIYDAHSKLIINEFPEFLSFGWEYYVGAVYAIDSIKKQVPYNRFTQVKFHLLDLKKIFSVDALGNAKLNREFIDMKLDLILGVPLKAEVNLIASLAKQKNIPFVSVFLPSLADQENNPNFIVLNPKFKTHIIELIKFLHKENPLKPVYIITKENEKSTLINGVVDFLNKGYFSKINAIQISSSISNAPIASNKKIKISSGKNAILILSLDTAFADNFIQQLNLKYAKNSAVEITVGGPPIWKKMTMVNQLSANNISLVYSDPFYLNDKDIVSKETNQHYQKQFLMPPSEIFWIGYKSTLYFTNLLIRTKNINEFVNKLNSGIKGLSNPFVFYSKDMLINGVSPNNACIENQHLYFMSWTNGKLKISEN